MKILHIMRSAPDELTRGFIQGMSKGESAKEVRLYERKVDYDQLVKDIFEHERVICWW